MLQSMGSQRVRHDLATTQQHNKFMYLLKDKEAKVTIYILPDTLLLLHSKKSFYLLFCRTIKHDSLPAPLHNMKWWHNLENGAQTIGMIARHDTSIMVSHNFIINSTHTYVRLCSVPGYKIIWGGFCLCCLCQGIKIKHCLLLIKTVFKSQGPLISYKDIVYFKIFRADLMKV